MALSEDKINELYEQRKQLYEKLYDRTAQQIRGKINMLGVQLEKHDKGFFSEAIEHFRTISFLMQEVWGEELDGDIKAVADDEIKERLEIIQDIANRRGKDQETHDYWASFSAEVVRLVEHLRNARKVERDIQAQIAKIEKQLPAGRTVWKSYKASDEYHDTSDGDDAWRDEEGEHDFEDMMLMNDWNERVRRLEYYNRSENFENLKPHHSEEEFQELRDDPHAPPLVGWHMEPAEEQAMEIENLQNQIKWLEIDVERTHRLSTRELKEKEEENKSIYRLAKQSNIERNKPGKTWRQDDLDNIKLLQEMEIEGHIIDILFHPRDDHVQRDLCVRFGVDVGRVTRTRFQVKYYSHLNNFVGRLIDIAAHREIILGLKINELNKVVLNSPELSTFHTRTVLRPMDEADRYLELERKYIPGGVGCRKYTRKDLIAAYYKIMAELYPDEKKASG